jgi:hypothetical protein
MEPRSFVLFFSAFLLTQTLFADYGPSFIADKKSLHPLDGPGQKLSMKFSCRQDMNVLGVSVHCDKTVDPPAYLVGLHPDEKGLPSSKALGSFSFIPRADGWNTLPLNNIPLKEGRTYHLVLEWDAHRGGHHHKVGRIGPTHYAAFSSTDPWQGTHPRDGAKDPASGVLLFDGKKWKELSLQPLYALHGAGTGTQGNPYNDPGERPIHGNDTPKNPDDDVLQGEALHPHAGMSPKGFKVRVRKKGNPSHPLHYRVHSIQYLKGQTSKVFSGLAFGPERVGTSYRWLTVLFDPKDQPQSFPPECRAIAFQTNSGRSDGKGSCDDCYLVSDVGSTGGLPGADFLSFDGGAHLSRATSSNDGGKTWSDEFERDAHVVLLGPHIPPEPKPVPPIPTPLPWGWGFLP